MMSSEEEKEDQISGERYFEVKPLPWRTKKFVKLIKRVDHQYKENTSRRSLEQCIPRKPGTPSKRAAPKKLEYGYDSFIKK